MTHSFWACLWSPKSIFPKDVHIQYIFFKIRSIALDMGFFSILLSVNSRNLPMTFMMIVSLLLEREREKYSCCATPCALNWTTYAMENVLKLILVLDTLIGDVLSGTTSGDVHHRGILEGWFGAHLWNSRAIVLLATALLVFAPLVSFKRLGMCTCLRI